MSYLQRITVDRDKGITDFTIVNDGGPLNMEQAIKELVEHATAKAGPYSINMRMEYK